MLLRAELGIYLGFLLSTCPNSKIKKKKTKTTKTLHLRFLINRWGIISTYQVLVKICIGL